MIGCRYNDQVERAFTFHLDKHSWPFTASPPLAPKTNPRTKKTTRCNCVHGNLSVYYAKEQNAFMSIENRWATLRHHFSFSFVIRLNYLLILVLFQKVATKMGFVACDTAGHFHTMRISSSDMRRRAGCRPVRIHQIDIVSDKLFGTAPRND